MIKNLSDCVPGRMLALLAVCGASMSATAQPLTPAFTYQGSLQGAGAPVNGQVDIQFTLFDQATGGTVLGSTFVANNVDVVDGRFTTVLNAGGEFANAFNIGNRRWLEIAVRSPAGSASPFVALSPRQELTASPFATFAVQANYANLLGGFDTNYYRNATNLNAGTVALSRLPASVARTDTPQTFTGLITASAGINSAGTVNASAFTGSGAGLTALNATNLGTGTLADARLSTNVPLKNGNNTFSGPNILQNPANIFTGSGAGLISLNASNISNGSLADARLSTNVALRGATQTFSGINTFSGATNVTGALTATNAANVLSGTFDGGFSGSFTGDGAALSSLNASNISTGSLSAARLPASGAWAITGTLSVGSIHFANNGTRLGIGTSTPTHGFEVTTDMRVGDGAGPHLDINRDSITSVNGATPLALRLNYNAGDVYLAMSGNTHVRVLQIHGADVAEKFPISGETPRPGMVMMIDEKNPGKLTLAQGAYNPHVAGVVSGANDLPAGTILGNLPGSESQPPIALSGRVWVWADATTGAIRPGDMLTTSETPGHAMRATDRDRSYGSVIGKAMTELETGTGMVLVLVNLK